MANLTKTDFIEQAQLHSRNPSRTFKPYVATNVLAIKSDFLRSRSVNTAAHFPKYDAASHGQLVPKLDFDKSNDLALITADIAGADDNGMDTDVMDTDAIGADAVNTNPLDGGAEPNHTSSVHTDAVDADFSVEPNPHSPSYYDTKYGFPFGPIRRGFTLYHSVYGPDYPKVEGPQPCPTGDAHPRRLGSRGRHF